jgi:predicted nucleic acid-binding protein
LKFWDTSALVPLLVPEPSTGSITAVLRDDGDQTVWWATEVECLSAIARRERAGAGTSTEIAAAVDLLRGLSASWVEVAPTDPVRVAARRLVRSHDLRSADAFQLAAAVVTSESQPELLELVTLDERLADAARREGFTILGLA